MLHRVGRVEQLSEDLVVAGGRQLEALADGELLRAGLGPPGPLEVEDRLVAVGERHPDKRCRPTPSMQAPPHHYDPADDATAAPPPARTGDRWARDRVLDPVIGLLLWPAVVGVAVMLVGARLNRLRSGLAAMVCLTAPAITLAWAASQLGEVNGGGVVTTSVAWMPAFGIDIDLRLDSLSMVMLLLAAGIGMLLGTLTFELLKNKYLVHDDGTPVGMPKKKMDMQTILTILGSVAFIFILLNFKSWFKSELDPIGYLIYGAMVAMPIILFSDRSLVKEEKQRISVIFIQMRRTVSARQAI